MKNKPKYISVYRCNEKLEFCFEYAGYYHFVYEDQFRPNHFCYKHDVEYSHEELKSYGWETPTREELKAFFRTILELSRKKWQKLSIKFGN